MALILDHTNVPARDKIASAKFLAELFGLTYDGPFGPFAPVRINDSLTMDFDDRWKQFEIHHYAFHVSEAEFDSIFGRVKARGLTYGSEPYAQTDMQIREFNGGRTVYFKE